MNTVININSDALVRFSNKLERMGKSALPTAVRSALNKAAFDVKTKTMPDSANDAFIQRKPNFFKANSKVVMARGSDLRTMKATVGFIGKGTPDRAVEDLEQQEHGGDIGGRSYIPLKQARTGGNWRKNVRASNRISDIKGKVVDSRNVKGRNAREQFIKSAVHAGKGGFVLGDRRTAGGNRILFQVRSMKRIKGQMKVKSVPMFALKSGRKVKPKATHFMERASMKSARHIEQHFITAAKRQLQYLK